MGEKTSTTKKYQSEGRNKPISSSTKAGLQFPVGRIARYLKEGRYAPRISLGSAVFLASVLEYLTAELLEISGSAAKDNKKKRINPRHITLAIGSDDEFKALTKDVHISFGGVVPHIHSLLVPKRSATNALEKSLNTSTEEPTTSPVATVLI